MADLQCNMSKDIRKIKSKVIGPLSIREAICLGLGGGMGFLAYKGLGVLNIANDVRGVVAIILMIPFIMFGWFKIYDMYMEEFIKTVLPLYSRPSERFYDTGLDKEYKELVEEYNRIGGIEPIKKTKGKSNIPRLK